jgi:hypothetical protein
MPSNLHQKNALIKKCVVTINVELLRIGITYQIPASALHQQNASNQNVTESIQKNRLISSNHVQTCAKQLGLTGTSPKESVGYECFFTPFQTQP